MRKQFWSRASCVLILRGVFDPSQSNFKDRVILDPMSKNALQAAVEDFGERSSTSFFHPELAQKNSVSDIGLVLKSLPPITSTPNDHALCHSPTATIGN